MDRVLLVAVLIMVIIGIFMIYSASSYRGAEKYGDSNQFLKQHVLRVFLGLFFLLVVSRIDYHWLRWITPGLLLIIIVMLVYVFFQSEFHGTHRSFAVAGKRFQPSEFMKLTCILYLSAVFARGIRSNALQNKQVFIHYCIVLLTVGLIFIEPDLSTALVLFSIALVMFFLAGVEWKQLFKMVWIIPPLIALGLIMFPYQRARIGDFKNLIFGKAQLSYQVKQSIIGLAHGGLTGVGYGEGKQKLSFLPEPFSDFILASLGEELGFIGLCFIFILLSVILWRGIRIALRAPDQYGYLLAGGITAMIMISALMNAGVIVHLLPTTGLPFPFISYGGSALVVQMIGIGILLNISQRRSFFPNKLKIDDGQETIWEGQ